MNWPKEALHTCGLAHLRLRTAANPSFLPLIGAARSLPRASLQSFALVADFGGSRAKRGLAAYDASGSLSSLRVLPPLSTAGLTGAGRTAELAAAICEILGDTLREIDPGIPLAEEILCSAATYVINGRPAVYPGAFSQLYQIATDINTWFDQRIGAASGRPVRLTFVHDCDAAACAFAGQPRIAVIMLGTALGAGFAPPAGRCRPLAEGFRIEISPG